jgi:SAM-dependent methyltransferase
MSTVTRPNITPDAIFQLAQGFMASKLFLVAGELNLFEQLANGPRSGDQLAAALGLPVRSVGVVANAMVALGMLRLEDGRYRNGDIAQTFLAGHGPADMRPLLRFFNQLTYPNWSRLETAVRSDGQKEKILDFSAEEQAVFSAGVEAATTGGAVALAATYDFGRHARLLDVGGGTGSFLRIIGQHHPLLDLALFEVPHVAALARSRFSPNEADRIATIEGDALHDVIPTGFDALLLSHVLHCFSVEENRRLLQRLCDAVNSGGRLLIVEFFLDETKTSPVPCALMSAEFLLNTNGIAYSASEIRRFAEPCGWRFIEHRPLAGPVSLMVLEK